MTLVYGSNEFVALRPRAEANLTLERAYTLAEARVVGDGYALPRPITLRCVYAPSSADPVLGVEETMAHLITLGAAIRDAVRLEASLGGSTYTRTLRPGGKLTLRRLKAGVAEYDLELLPGEPWWRRPDNAPVLLYIG